MNFSFLNPYFLWGLPLAALPLIIHLLTRRKFRSIFFSSIIFLKRASQKILPRYRLRHYLLLLVRTAIIVLLAFFFARPIINFSGATGKSVNLAAVILLDSSYSMGALVNNRTKFEQAQEIIKKIIAHFHPQDRLALITFSDRIENKISFSLSNSGDLLKAVNDAQITFRPTEVVFPLEEAYRLLSGWSSSEKEIILVGDFARHGWKKLVNDKIQGFDPKVKVCFLRIGGGEENMTLQKLTLTAAIEKRKQTFPAGIENFSLGDKKSVRVALFVGDKEADSGFSNISKGGKVVKELSYTFGEKGDIPGYLELAADSLELDNRYFFIQKVLAAVPVLCLDGDRQFVPVRQETYYLRLALAPDKTSSLDIKTVSLGELENTDYQKYSVLILANCDLTEKQARIVKDYWRQGGKLIIFSGEKVNPSRYNSLLGNLLPGKLNFVVSRKETIKLADAEHPALKIFADPEQIDLKTTVVEKFITVDPNEESRILFSYADGQPAVLENQRVIFFTTTADRDWTNFPIKPIYVSLLQNLINYLSLPKEEEVNNFLIGEEFRHIFADVNSSLGVVYPDGRKEEKKGKPINFIWKKPGIYRLIYKQQGKEVVRNCAVNIDFAQGESDLTPMSLSEIKAKFPKIVLIDIKEGWEKKFLENLRGQEVNRPLLALIVLFLVTEVFLANPRKRK